MILHNEDWVEEPDAETLAEVVAELIGHTHSDETGQCVGKRLSQLMSWTLLSICAVRSACDTIWP